MMVWVFAAFFFFTLSSTLSAIALPVGLLPASQMIKKLVIDLPQVKGNNTVPLFSCIAAIMVLMSF